MKTKAMPLGLGHFVCVICCLYFMQLKVSLGTSSCCMEKNSTNCCGCNETCVLSGDKCTDTCKSNHYTMETNATCSNRICEACDIECDGCKGPSNKNCIACKNFTYYPDTDDTTMFDCISQCPTGFFISQDKKNCSACQIRHCFTCEITNRDKVNENFENFTTCKTECDGFFDNIDFSASRDIARCTSCEDGKYLHTPANIPLCSCCVLKCPKGFTESDKVCKKRKNQWCEDKCTILYAVIGVAIVVIVVVIVVVILCVRCQRNLSAKEKKAKPPPSASELKPVHDERKKQRNVEDDTHSHDSTTAVPLLPVQSGTSGYINVPKNPPPLPNLRPETADQEEYTNVSPRSPAEVQQEIYVNEEVLPTPSLPPRKGSKREDEEDDRPDYENEDVIETLHASNPHLKREGLSVKSTEPDAPLPSPKGHAPGNKKKGYVNQDVIDQQEAQATDGPTYENAAIGKQNQNALPVSDRVGWQSNDKSVILGKAVPPPEADNGKPSVPYYNVTGGGNYYNQAKK